MTYLLTLSFGFLLGWIGRVEVEKQNRRDAVQDEAWDEINRNTRRRQAELN